MEETMLKRVMSAVTLTDTHMRKLFAPAWRTVGDFTGLTSLSCSGRRVLAIWIAAAMLNLCTTVGFASARTDTAQPTGMIAVRGLVTIDGLPAISGQTLFSGSSIVIAERSESRLD